MGDPRSEQPPPAPVLDYASRTPREQPLKTYLAHSIVTVLIFWPLGIAALVNSIMAERALRRGDWLMAERHATKAVTWGISAILAWFLILIGIAIVVVFS